MFRVRLISDYFGVDEGGPIHATQEEALRAARVMLSIHSYPVRAEIREFVDDRFVLTRVVGVLERSK
jgi:hypothetical protein